MATVTGYKFSGCTVWRVICWLLVAPAAIWAVIRLFGLERGPLGHTPAIQLLAFTPYVAAWSVLPLAVSLALRQWTAAGVALVVVALLAWAVVPRWVNTAATPAGASNASDHPSVRILTSNMLVGKADPATLLGLVRDHRVDVLALQEYTSEAQEALEQAGIGGLLPYRETYPDEGGGGSALYARFPLHDGGVRKNGGGFLQAYALMTVPGAAPLLVESAHPSAPYRLGDQLSIWWSDLAEEPTALAGPDGMTDLADTGPAAPLRILAGDFNATLDHAALRRLIGSGYRDAAEAMGSGLIGTWGPYKGHPIPPVTLDHVLVDKRIGVRAVSVHRVPGSDHRAVFADLAVPPA
jgi:endonuclease/exonuclease/phosphatase (EEP) superfamily protein YafD